MALMKKEFWKYERDFEAAFTNLISISHEFDLVIFDLDHTLYNEHEYLHSAYKLFLAAEVADINDLSSRLTFLMQRLAEHGKRKNLFQLYARKYQSRLSLDFFLNTLRKNRVKKLNLFHGAEEALRAMSQNTTLSVLTNGNKAQQTNKMTLLKLNQLFREDLLHYASDSEPKPSPLGIHRIIHQCNKPKRVIMIGDSKEDRQASISAGISFINIDDICPKIK